MAKKIFLALLMSCLALFASASNYLTFTAEEDSSSFCIENMNNNPNIEYSLDDGETWTLLEADEKEGISEYVILGKKGDKALLRGYNPNGFSVSKFESHELFDHYTVFNMRGKIAASGSVMSLIDGIGECKTIPSDYCFYCLFVGCESLTQAPELPATTLADNCYDAMFNSCTSLTQAPALPAMDLARSCYSGMFEYCESLIQAPELPATTLAEYCYSEMFDGCTNLVQAPELPATTLADNCYLSMFWECTSLTQAPALPATTLAKSCYSNMFADCTNLVQAPALPATTLAEYCYSYMFNRCTSLVQAPALPATTLAEYCYSNMFNGCTSLVQAPELPAMELADCCYKLMFQNCRNLQKIKVGFDSWRGLMYSWVEYVAHTGTFYCPKGLPIKYGIDRIPAVWNVEYIDDGADVAEHISDASFNAWGVDGKITYIGATMPVEIYDLGGRLVKKVKGKSQSVVVPQHGIYVVKSGNVSLKVEL